MKTIIVWSLAAVTLCGCGSSGGSAPTSPSPPTAPPTSGGSSSVTWGWTGTEWRASGTAPACPSPLVYLPPVDLARVTSILYPGQSRPDYKPHGGFRFDLAGQTNNVQMTVPMNATIYRGARFLAGGEIQYTFDFINDCGIMHRIGHLRDLSPRYQALADAFPAALEGDSRTTNVPLGLTASAGEVVATAIGLRNTSNVFADWGVYDLRQRNTASNDPAWFATHNNELAAYSTCWLDFLGASNSALVRALPPGDPTAGKTSDYCR